MAKLSENGIKPEDYKMGVLAQVYPYLRESGLNVDDEYLPELGE